jgi:hypothetical protein
VPIPVPAKVPFAPKKVAPLRNFSLGLNNKFSSLTIDDKEVQDILNANYDEKGAIKKRKGYAAHYGSSFDSNPARDAFNYRKQDGTSRIIIAAGDKLYYDKPQFVQLYDAQADWETAGTVVAGVSTRLTAGDIVLQSMGLLGQFLLGAASALLGGSGSSSRSGTWRSNTIDISAVTDQTSGKVLIAQTLPTSTTVTVQTRTSADGSTWSAWANLGASDTIVSPADDFLQLLVTMTSTTSANPSVQSLQVTFDTTAAVVQLASGLSALARYTFATQNDTVYICNGVDANQKWNGTTFTTQGGSPPSAKYVKVHKNFMFLAGNTTNPSRVFFSALGDPETWPALNFIDVGKGDGDQITGLAILLDRLVITKTNSVWLLEGDSSANFVLRRITDTAGCVDMHSIVVVRDALGMLARDGFYFFDGVKMALASEKVIGTFDTLNKSQFGLVAAVYDAARRKVFCSIPSAGMLFNDTVLVFDELRTAWTIYKGINAASWVVWRQFNTDHLLFGDATTGQMYDAETGYSDNGAAISMYVVTKAQDLGGSELAKFPTQVLVDAKETSGNGSAMLSVSYFKDLSATESAVETKTITGTQNNIARFTPSAKGISIVRDIAIKVAESSSDRSITIYGVTTEYQTKPGLRQAP